MEVPTYSPREIVSELDRFIVGQDDAKRAVAIALRNRWRRQQLPEAMREEVVPKNILMIGPTGCGKTEIARRLAKLAQAPFLKVEATKFTEVGYVGRDVESIARDLVEASLNMLREASRKEVQAQGRAGGGGAADHRAGRRRRGGRHALEIPPHAAQRRVRAEGDRDRGLRVAGGMPIGQLDIPGMPPGQVINLGEMMKGMLGNRPQQKRQHDRRGGAPAAGGRGSRPAAGQRPADQGRGVARREQRHRVHRRDRQGLRRARWRAASAAATSRREGVQRDLLPLIEGTTVSTKYGPVKTDHVLFIASGAFHLAKPSDLLPELQGRLPIRVELAPLSRDDLRRILTEPEHSLLKQYAALLGTEKVTLDFTDDAVDALADLAADINDRVENIGARRLHTVLERLLEEISFTATDRAGETITVDAAYVNERVAPLAQKGDLSRFIL